MRVYLPATTTQLRALARDREFGPPPWPGFTAVVSTAPDGEAADLRSADSQDTDSDAADVKSTDTESADIEATDRESAEYAAAERASDASLQLLATDPAAIRRRVVVAADVPHARLSVRDNAGVVQVLAPVSIADIASIHIDDRTAEAAVTAWLAEAPTLPGGVHDDGLTLADHALGWYATQELGALLDELEPPPR